ncbi:uncharacterized protein L3040_005464 [Drepanopeziza brunnea f. sp. 'multigermtubi']|uniref:uncharacterized protein n=1 Tax=Drepanopeziza brunnea f. sp. 'multigermtubi' TaxID=698441 RepID=UPI002389B0A1|nr:hypothetical protein L3040_005464 [Drepanopeziza brunnea f. sp. 'multigermtubi']
MLIENIHLLQTGGEAPLLALLSWSIPNIENRNVYIYLAIQPPVGTTPQKMSMIKSNGSSSTVESRKFHNFIGPVQRQHLLPQTSTPTGASQPAAAAAAGSGVEFSGLSFNNWNDTAANGVPARPHQDHPSAPPPNPTPTQTASPPTSPC